MLAAAFFRKHKPIALLMRGPQPGGCAGAIWVGGENPHGDVSVNIQAQRDFIDRRQLVTALRALRRGDFSVRLPEETDGVDGEIATLFNEVVSMNEAITHEFERLSK